MKTWQAIAMGSMMTLGFGGRAAAQSAQASLTLTREGKPAASIILAEKPTKAAQFAAFELQWHVKAISGATLPIERQTTDDGRQTTDTGPTKDGKVRIYVGDTQAARALGLTQSSFKSQEYTVRSSSNVIVLVGKDADDQAEVKLDPDALGDGQKNANWPGLLEGRGSLHAVYDFLQQSCGIRWFNPADTGMLIPKTPTLAVQEMSIRRKPAYRYRNVSNSGPQDYFKEISLYAYTQDKDKVAAFEALEKAAFADLYKQTPAANVNAAAKRQAQLLYEMRLRNGGEKSFFNHSFYHYYDLYWAPSKDKEAAKYFIGKRPELFAQGYSGDQPPQMCYTSKELVKLVAREARDYFVNKGYTYKAVLMMAPLGMKYGENYFSLEPMDNVAFCRCPECRKWIELGKDNGNVAAEMSKGIHSDYWFQFVNAVQEEFARIYPGTDKHLITGAYSSHTWLPKTIKLDPRVAVVLCFTSSGTPAAAREYENEVRLLQAWGAEAKLSGRMLDLWTYNMNRQGANAYDNFYCFPDFYGHILAGQIKMFRQLGYGAITFCGDNLEVDAYLAFRLMDNPDLDVNQLLDEYFNGLYGAAAAPMKKLYQGMEEVYCNPSNYPSQKGAGGIEIAWKYLGTAERMAAYEKLMNEARSLVKTERERRNLEIYDLGIWQYMLTGRAIFVERASAPIPEVVASRIPDANGNPDKVDWTKTKMFAENWYEKSSKTPSSMKAAARIGHDETHLYVELVEFVDPKKLQVAPGGTCPFDDWEIFMARQRGQPMRQIMMGPKGDNTGFSYGEINWRQFVPDTEHGLKSFGLKVTSDTSFPDRWVTRLSLPLDKMLDKPVKAGDKIYMNILRVRNPELAKKPMNGIETWVPYTTVFTTDRLGQVTLE